MHNLKELTKWKLFFTFYSINDFHKNGSKVLSIPIKYALCSKNCKATFTINCNVTFYIKQINCLKVSSLYKILFLLTSGALYSFCSQNAAFFFIQTYFIFCIWSLLKSCNLVHSRKKLTNLHNRISMAWTYGSLHSCYAHQTNHLWHV